VSRLGRYVGRARGSALRTAGVPRTPNLPSARAYAQRAVRSAVPVDQRGRTARGGASGGPTTGGARQPVSRQTSTISALLTVAAVALVIYLLTYEPPAPVVRPPAVSCHDQVVYEGTRLSDC
jgi:hypothetical protein